MKLLFAALLISLVSAMGTSFAATPVAEPETPSDKYLTKELSCTKYAGKVLVKKTYRPTIGGVVRKITTLTLNGKKIAQIDKGPQGTVYYVKDSSSGYWLLYTKGEIGEAIAHLLAEVELTQRQFLACGT